MPIVTALFVGLLFGVGLIVAGMTDPAKVLAFFDVAGSWDPSLAFVIGGAIAIGLVAFRVAGRREATLLGTPMALPMARHIDARLVFGSALFGIGWGTAGFCPGPALVALGIGETKAGVFVAAMLAGMALFELIEHFRRVQLKRLADA